MNQAMLKHMKTDVGGVWLEPPAPADKPETEKQKQPMQEDHEVEDEMVDVVVDEGEGRVPAVPEEEMFQDYLVRPTSIRRPREEDGEGRVPEEDGEGRVPEEDGEGRVPEEDELMEDQYHFATANSGPPSSWVQIHVFDEENADRVDSQATTRRLGEHLNDDEGEDQPMPAIPEDAPPAKEVEDPVVNKVLQEMMTMGIERPAKAATVPVPEPREPFLQKEEDLGTATGPEGRVPRGQNKIFREETAEEATLRVLRERIPTCTKTVTLSKVCGLCSRARMPKPVPEGREFDPNYNKRQFNNMTATVLTQLLMAVHEITIREADLNKLTVPEKARDWEKFRSKGSKTVVVWGFLQEMGVEQVSENSEPGEWHMWLQREKGLAVIEKMLGLMFGLCKPSNNEKIFGKNLTYWHWIEASKELKDRYGQTDLNTGWWYEPKDLNNWIIPLVGKIWEAYNYTMLVFCVKKVEQKARADAVGDIIRPSELLDLALEDDGEDMKVQEEVLVYHSNSQFVPDWGLTADGFES